MEKQVIYLDVLLIFNLYMNYMMLSLTARLTHTRLQFKRGLPGALVGSLGALAVLLPELPGIVTFCMKAGMAFLICFVAFGKQRILKNTIAFFLTSFLLAGALLGVSLCTEIQSVQKNSYWYFDISVTRLVIVTILIYGGLSVIQFCYNRFHSVQGRYEVQIQYQEQTCILEGLADTGNSLVDFYTGKPVIICDQTKLTGMTSPAHSHILPYVTINGEGMLTVFQPDEISISSETGIQKKVDALVGIGKEPNGKAIFNPKLISY